MPRPRLKFTTSTGVEYRCPKRPAFEHTKLPRLDFSVGSIQDTDHNLGRIRCRRTSWSLRTEREMRADFSRTKVGRTPTNCFGRPARDQTRQSIRKSRSLFI